MIEVLQKLIFVFKNYIHTLIHYSIVGSGIIGYISRILSIFLAIF